MNWKGAGRVERKIVDLREQVLDVSGQEIMSADKVTLRVNLLVNYRVVDARLAAESVGSYEQALYREAQLALREAIGGRPLDKLLGRQGPARQRSTQRPGVAWCRVRS